MAGKDHLIERLIEIVATFDDAAWIALANKGLYRRAQKDLEKGIAVETSEETEGGLQMYVEDFTVTLPEAGPGKATCTCPSPGICQHILAACLFLKKEARSFSPSILTDIEEELLVLNHKQLRKWAGSADFKAAVKLASGEDKPLIEKGNPLVITLPSVGIVCRYPAGTGLDGMIVTGPARKRKQWIVAAVLVFQHLRGRPLPEIVLAKAAQTEDREAPRTRQEVLISVQHLLEDTVSIGLSHLSLSIQERFATLAMSAQGVKLYRLSLALRGIADDVGLLLERSGQADVERLFLNMARTYALSEALKNSENAPIPELVGWSKSQYTEVAASHLTGVGAYPWRTHSGYQGLTILFWENERQELFSWSDARPEQSSGGFDPVSRYIAESPWEGGQSPKVLSHNTFTLLNGRKNPHNRLSSSSQTQIVHTGVTRIEAMQFGDRLFTDWEKLMAYAWQISSIGLTRGNPLKKVVFLKPARWGKRAFDPTQQVFYWWLEDEARKTILLVLDYSVFTGPSIHALEHLKPPKDGSWLLVARIGKHYPLIQVVPYALLKPGEGDDTVYNVAFDARKKKHKFLSKLRHAAKEARLGLGDVEEFSGKNIILIRQLALEKF